MTSKALLEECRNSPDVAERISAGFLACTKAGVDPAEAAIIEECARAPGAFVAAASGGQLATYVLAVRQRLQQEAADWRASCGSPKKDGTYDPRENDLVELSKDWLFYRRKIMEHPDDPSYREDFGRVNAWLDAYPAEAVSRCISRYER